MMKRNDSLCLVSALTLFTFVVLFLYRSADDNRLTSWQWVFAVTPAGTVLLIITTGLILCFFLVKHSVSLRYPSLFLLSVTFGVTTLFWSEPEVIIDASRYFTQAKHLEQFGIRYFVQEWGRTISPWTDLPLVPFIYGLILALSDESRLAIQIFTSLTYSLTAVVVYHLGKDLWDEETGFTAALLLMGMPYLFIQVPLFLVDIPTMFFFTLAVFAFQRAVRRGGFGSIVLSSIAVTMALFSKFSMWPVLLFLPAAVLLSLIRCGSSTRSLNPNMRDKNEEAAADNKAKDSQLTLAVCLRRCAAIVACSSVLAAAVIVPKYDVFAGQISLLLEYQKPGLKRWGESFVSTFFFQVHPFITITAICSLWIAFRRQDARYIMISCFVLIAVLFQVKRIRYVMPVFPMLSMMAAYGSGVIRDGELRRFTVSCVLVSSLAISLFAYLPFTRTISTVNLKKAGELLNAHGIERAEVYVLPREHAPLNPAVAVPILDLFTKAKIIFFYHPSDYTPEEPVGGSALRFTWEYKNPVYYQTRKELTDSSSALVIVTDEKDYHLQTHLEERIKKLQLLAFYDSYEEAFQSRTFVAVYGPLNENPDIPHKQPGS